MRIEDKNIIADRIREGRIFKKMTQAELATALNLKKQSVSQYEIGLSLPKAEVLLQLCAVLGMSWDYFYKPCNFLISTPIFFRKLRNTSKKDNSAFEVNIKWVAEIYNYLRNFIEFPSVNFIKYEQENYTFEEIQEISVNVRRHFGLGLGPIDNLTLLLENNGFIISKASKHMEKIDACSFVSIIDGSITPFIFLTKDKSAVHSRFDLAHELGHMVLHSWMDKDSFSQYQIEIDKEADVFAGAFLVPEDSIKRESVLVNSLDSLILLKKRWICSAAMLLRRMNDLELLNDSKIKRLKDHMYSKGWKTREPLDDVIKHEKIYSLSRAIQLLVEQKVQTKKQIIDSIALPQNIIETLCSLPDNFLLDEPTKIVDLQLVKTTKMTGHQKPPAGG